MNYQRHYDLLIDRAKNRTMPDSVYLERHHIIPRCMKGANNLNNLVNLTPEEHFIAHQLLVKIYPKNPGLIRAANFMCSGSQCNKRSNKLYGWLRKKLANSMIGNNFNTLRKNTRHNTATKKKLSEGKQGELNPMFGKVSPNKGKILGPASDEHKAKNSESMKRVWERKRIEKILKSYQ